MTATYWIAKYVEDPFRNETRNVGVIVLLNGIVCGRFFGEREDGSFDQRKLRGLAHVVAYVQWRDFWRRKIFSNDIDGITKAITVNFSVTVGGEVSDTDGDSATEVCNFLYNLVVGTGPVEAFGWDDADEAEIDLATEISNAFEQKAILEQQNMLFAKHPIKKGEKINGRHVIHTPSFAQRNGRLYVMEHIDLAAKKINKSKERAGWMAYMFSDIRELDSACQAYSLIRPEGENHSDQIEYARSVLAGESIIINWSDQREREKFIEERRGVAEPNLNPIS